MRLIDADALAEKMEKEIYRYWNEDGGGYYLAEDAIEEVKYAPTVEAEPVRHGKWIPIIDEYETRYMLTGYKCLLCGRCEEKEEPYCHCGAKMDGGMIHCKDCVWYEPDSGICTQFEHDELFSENDGCNQGKRRGD